jgi:hypothetical protein
MNALHQIKAANAAATAIIQTFVAGHADTPDAVALRTEELEKMSKKELIAHVLVLEKPKTEGGIKIEQVAKAILESPECAMLTYEQIAGMIVAVVPDAKTSSKSIASYASKRKDEWAIVPRVRAKFSMGDLLGMVGETTAQAVNQ